jgi:protein-S-isoprenylcysteine O-methyltransferase Ste14
LRQKLYAKIHEYKKGVQMYIWFFVSLFGFVAIILPYFLSLEHLKLEENYGAEKGKDIGEAFGVVSGWGFFLFWFGIWLSPQARFTIPLFQDFFVRLPVINLTVPLLHLLIFVPLFVVGAWFGIRGVTETTLKVAETHRPVRIVTTGVYSIVRHPQYLGGLIAHIGISFLLSASYSLLSTPLITAIIYFISRKEEDELLKEFGEEYAGYKNEVPMLLPRWKSGENQKNL